MWFDAIADPVPARRPDGVDEHAAGVRGLPW